MAARAGQRTVAEHLKKLGVKGVLIQMANHGQLLELTCEMPTCYRRHAARRRQAGLHIDGTSIAYALPGAGRPTIALALLKTLALQGRGAGAVDIARVGASVSTATSGSPTADEGR